MTFKIYTSYLHTYQQTLMWNEFGFGIFEFKFIFFSYPQLGVALLNKFKF